VLSGRGVTHSFGGLRAVKNLDFDVSEGEIVGLIGPNGAGKTTLFNLVSGAIPPKEGTIRFKGEDITGLRPDQICHRGLARTFQTTKLFTEMSGFDNVRLALVFGNPGRGFTFKQAEAEANLMMASAGMLGDRNKPVKDLPLASRRRLEIARALATNPDMLMLDEAMAGLTPGEISRSIELVRSLRDRGVTILMIEHVMAAIMEVCDRIVVLHNGEKLAEGTPAEVAEDPKVRSVYLGS
jgi:branched-chain amino acid transport system ATP-binding protein